MVARMNEEMRESLNTISVMKPAHQHWKMIHYGMICSFLA